MAKGNLNINGFHGYSIDGDVITYGTYETGKPTVKISNALLYAPKMNTFAIRFDAGSYSATLDNVKAGGGTKKEWSGIRPTKSPFAVLSTTTTGKITINGDSGFYSGQYGGSPISTYGGGDLDINGTTSLYALNPKDDWSEIGRSCISIELKSGSIITINSTGQFFAKGKYVCATLFYEVNGTNYEPTVTYRVNAGEYVSRLAEVMFRSGGKDLSSCRGTKATKPMIFKYLTGYKDAKTEIKTEEVSDCYYYSK